MVINYAFIFYTTSIIEKNVFYTIGAMVFVFTITYVFYKITT